MDQAGQAKFFDVKRDRRTELLISRDVATDLPDRDSLNWPHIATVIEGDWIALRAEKLKNACPSRVAESFEHQNG